jgi:hypothetical protein
MIEMKKIQIHYYAGESRYLGHGQPIAVDYLISDPLDWEFLPEDGFDGPIFSGDTAADLIQVNGKYHLYAETENPTWDEEAEEYEDETATYDNLKTEIIELAKKIGIDPSRVIFPYDE